MAKESEVDKLKDEIEADVAQYEKIVETSTEPLGEFIAATDAEEKSDQLNLSLSDTMRKRLEAASNKLETTPEEIAKKAIAQYLDSLEKGKKAK